MVSTENLPLKKSQLQRLDFPHLSAEERFLFLRLVNHSSSCLFSPKNSEDRLGRKKNPNQERCMILRRN